MKRPPSRPGRAGCGELDAGELDAGVLAQVLAGRVLTWVQDWLAGPAGGARLVVLTRDAVLEGPAGGPGQRGAGRERRCGGWPGRLQAENPGRVILADLLRAGGGVAAAGGAGTRAGVRGAGRREARVEEEPEVAVPGAGQHHVRAAARPSGAGAAGSWRVLALAAGCGGGRHFG